MKNCRILSIAIVLLLGLVITDATSPIHGKREDFKEKENPEKSEILNDSLKKNQGPLINSKSINFDLLKKQGQKGNRLLPVSLLRDLLKNGPRIKNTKPSFKDKVAKYLHAKEREVKHRNKKINVLAVIKEILKMLGITDEDVIQEVKSVVDWVEEVLAQLPPEEVQQVEYAAGNILGMLQKNDVNTEALKHQFDIIYNIMSPYIASDVKPQVDEALQMIWWILQYLYDN